MIHIWVKADMSSAVSIPPKVPKPHIKAQISQNKSQTEEKHESPVTQPVTSYLCLPLVTQHTEEQSSLCWRKNGLDSAPGAGGIRCSCRRYPSGVATSWTSTYTIACIYNPRQITLTLKPALLISPGTSSLTPLNQSFISPSNSYRNTHASVFSRKIRSEVLEIFFIGLSQGGPLRGEVPPGSRRTTKGRTTPSSPSASGR